MPPWRQAAMEKVRADKLREVLDGHDGTWIAHPALLPIARQVRLQLSLLTPTWHECMRAQLCVLVCVCERVWDT